MFTFIRYTTGFFSKTQAQDDFSDMNSTKVHPRQTCTILANNRVIDNIDVYAVFPNTPRLNYETATLKTISNYLTSLLLWLR